MFKDWDINVALRDTIWGVSSISLISIAYVYFSKTYNSKNVKSLNALLLSN